MTDVWLIYATRLEAITDRFMRVARRNGGGLAYEQAALTGGLQRMDISACLDRFNRALGRES